MYLEELVMAEGSEFNFRFKRLAY